MLLSQTSTTLYYIHDPMCSWCWGFAPVWAQLQQQLAGKLKIQSVLGGLAADSDEAMPKSMQISIQDNWRRIQQTIPGIAFNYDFWTQCQPRRSTYPACRAIIASSLQQPELAALMLLAIQQAYYLQAKNPSDEAVLIKLAKGIGLDGEVFLNDLHSDKCSNVLKNDLSLAKKLGVSHFPSLVLSQHKTLTNIAVDYTNSANILQSIIQILAEDS